MRITPAIVFLVMVCLLCACIKNERDESNPSLSLNTSFIEDQIVSSGGFVSFQISCSDDIGVETVRVEVDCPLSDWNPTTDPDSAVQVIETLGETLQLTSAIQLVEDLLSETCTLTVTCLDEMGNESNSESLDFRVRNKFDSAGPVIELKDSILIDNEDPTAGLEAGIETPVSTGFKPDGCLTDSSSVDNVLLEILDDVGVIGMSIGNDYSELDSITISFDEWQLEAPSEVGEYRLRISATDSLNNTSQRIFPLIVVE